MSTTPITRDDARKLRTGLHVVEHFLLAAQDGHAPARQAAQDEAARLSDQIGYATGHPGPGGPAVLAALLDGAPTCRHCHQTVIRTGERVAGRCRVCRRWSRPDDRIALSCTTCGAMRHTSQDMCSGHCRTCARVTDAPVDPLADVLTALGVHQAAEEAPCSPH